MLIPSSEISKDPQTIGHAQVKDPSRVCIVYIFVSSLVSIQDGNGGVCRAVACNIM